QLVEEAVIFAGREVGGPLEILVAEHGAVAGTRAFVALWRKILESTAYEAGCPVLAVAVEQYIGEDGMPNAVFQQHLLQLARGIFENWQRIVAESLRKEGVPTKRAQRLAALVVSSIEGTVALCRAGKSSLPLNDVQHELELALSTAIAEARKS